MLVRFLSYNIFMELFNDFNYNPKLAIALGFFDGVHLGHQKVIKSAVDFAKQQNTKSAVITFKEHPCCIFYNVKPSYILKDSERRKQIENLGVDYLYEVDFKNLKDLTAKDYLEDILIKNFEPVSISTGFNHFFGSNKTGTPEFLEENQKKYGYTYIKTEPQHINDKLISSTYIRECLKNGDIKEVNLFLGRPFEIRGEVIHGLHLGATLGYKTANLDYPDNLIKIPYGAYKVTVNNKYNAVLNFGVKPTITNISKPVLEAHILDFDKDIYGETISIQFKDFIRQEQKFNSKTELMEQIKKDIKKCTE